MTPAIEEVLASLTEDASREFLRHWYQLRGSRLMPDRRDIDPASLGKLLPKLWMWEFIPARSDFVCRLAGNEIVDVFQRNPRGLTLAEWVPGPIAEVARPRYMRVMEDPAIAVAAGISFIAGNRRGRCERVVTPMTNGGDKPMIVFGMTVWRMPEYSPGPVEREETSSLYFPVRGDGAATPS